MATWAVTTYKQTVFGDERVVYATMVATGNYTAGGDTINASSFGLDLVDFVSAEATILSGGATALLSASPTTLPTASFKLQLFTGGTPLAEASGSITNATCVIEVRGV